MKIIATVGSGYIAEVSHTELEKVFDKYYGKLEAQKPGSELDIGGGWDFRSDIRQACRDMSDAVKSFERAQATMMRFAIMVSQLPSPGAEETQP